MATIEIPNVRQESTILMPTTLKDNGVAVDWSGLQNIKAYMYSDAQRVIAGKCDVEVDGEDATVLKVTYAATRPQYLGVNSLLVRCKYHGREKSYDVPVLNFVERTAQATGVTVLDDPVIDVEIEVDEVSTSLLDGAIAAALDAAVKAEEAASLVPLQVLEDCVEATENAETATAAANEAAAAASAAGITSVQASVADNEPGTPSVDAALLNKVLSLVFHHLKGAKGDTGATPNISVGTVTTGAPGTPVVITMTGTAAAPVLNITIPQGLKGEKGDQGNTGSSVEFPYELVNNLTTNDATKGLSAAQGVVLAGEISQLSQKVSEKSVTILGVGDFIFPIKPYGHSANDDKINADIKAGSTITGTITLGGGAVVTAGSQWQVYYFYSDNTNFHRNYTLPTVAFSETVEKDVIAIGFYIAGVTGAGTCAVHLEQSNPALYRERLATIESNVSTLQTAQTGNATHFDTLDKEVGLYKYSFTGSGYGHSSLLDQFPLDYKANTVLKGILRKGTGDGGGSTLQVYLFESDGTTWIKRENITFGTEFQIVAPSNAAYVGFYISPITTAGTFDVELSYKRVSYEIADLENRVESLENGELLAPSYFSENIEDVVKAARADAAAVGANGDSFVFITDIHWEDNAKFSPSIIRNLCNKLNINNVVFGGDAINGQANRDTAMSMMAEVAGQLMAAQDNNFVSVIGNHDYNGSDGGTAFANGPAVFYSIFNRKMDYIAVHGGEMYYYFDNPTTNTRYIVLAANADYSLPSAQTTWLGQILADTDADTNVIIFVHPYLRERAQYDGSTFIGYNFEISSGGESLQTVVDAAVQNGKKVQCIVSGHIHFDYNGQTLKNVPVIATDCDGLQSMQWPTTRGTINEQAFDVITIDFVNKVIKCRRIGRGKSRIIHYDKKSLSVNGTLDISQLVEITPTSYSTRDNNSAQYRNAAGGGSGLTYGSTLASANSSGIVTAIAAGRCVAVAENDDCIETFDIEIS